MEKLEYQSKKPGYSLSQSQWEPLQVLKRGGASTSQMVAEDPKDMVERLVFRGPASSTWPVANIRQVA